MRVRLHEQGDAARRRYLTSILLTPIPITQENLQEVVDAEWITAEDLCVDRAGTVGPCAS